MNTIHEIGYQNQQDFWAMLYLHMGRSIMRICGAQGEKAVRRAVRRMAEKKGRRLRESLCSDEIKTNLETLYALGCDCCSDPRFRMKILRQDENVRIWEVYTCPLAALWLNQGEGWLGSLYCEENQHGLINGFTEGVGQLNLTKKLTCRRTNGCRADDYCRFSAYYRTANADGEQRRMSFTGEDEEYRPFTSQKQGTNRDETGRRCIETLYYMLEAAGEIAGEDGVRAVAAGLRELAVWAADQMKYGMVATLNFNVRDYLEANLPVSMETGEEPLWEIYGGHYAPCLFELNFLAPFRALMGLV